MPSESTILNLFRRFFSFFNNSTSHYCLRTRRQKAARFRLPKSHHGRTQPARRTGIQLRIRPLRHRRQSAQKPQLPRRRMDVQLPQRPYCRYRYLQYDSYAPLAKIYHWTSMSIVRRGCITTSSGIMSLMQGGLLIRIRLGWLVEDSMNGFPFQWRINWKEQKLNVVPS